MKITLTIPENKALAFLEFLKTINYVEVEKQEHEYVSYPQWHDQVVKERLEAYLSNPSDIADFDKTMNDLEKEL